ncbi:cysteine desulfurase family protein [Octadecabacter sp. 1_MG-2023]|uniref:cysteine desulfurase family protein n=1 Tax=unclassified Octadecabacter TaxID=196158 RepID=UPI001C09F084|nr:cysteine desulfurase family protein [Octadecabacter sp. 1_MG-2023]MBU2993170.1 cysteine desulfurase [Octadecabacter sp. B2R22]MDO6733378.1 cysteine desulfurase family protein [Octadecabacter sp. 1_MG-2023]
MKRVYLDHNATTPVCAQARAAMIAAMDVVGNPSSVHAEGRAAKALLERARGQIADAIGASGADVVFVSGSTEAAALACKGRGLHGAAIEHDALKGWVETDLPVEPSGRVIVANPDVSVLQWANSETGVVQDLPQGLAVSDITQGVGRLPFSFSWSGIGMVFLSAHKFGGPKGVGALVFPQGTDVAAQITGGGQEMGRRSGTENIIGIAGMGAAIEAAMRDLESGVWERVEKLRSILENGVEAASKETILVGNKQARLPNTSCLLTPGWTGERQVMGLDLAGIAVSAGSACSSGKVKASGVLQAMGYSETDAASAIRVSLGPENTVDDVNRFVDVWTDRLAKHRARHG